MQRLIAIKVISPSAEPGKLRSKNPSFVRNVLLVIALWNWKSALLSIMLRAPVFAIAAARSGLRAITATVLVEVAVSAVNAGFLASIVQLMRNFRPLWVSALVIIIGVPTAGQALEWWVHAYRGTPHRHTAVLVSSVIAAVSALFNWYVMCQGNLLVGANRTSFLEDLRQLPVAIARFLSVGPLWLFRKFTAS